MSPLRCVLRSITLSDNSPDEPARVTAQQISSTSEEIRDAAARFIRAVRDASREIGFKASPAEHLFDAFRLVAAKALVSPEVNHNKPSRARRSGGYLGCDLCPEELRGHSRFHGTHRRGGKSLHRGGCKG